MADQIIEVDFLPVTVVVTKGLKAFDCGIQELNEYLGRGYAKKNHCNMTAPCTVMVPKGAKAPVLGYMAVANSSVAKKDLPPEAQAKLPRYPVPVTLIAQLAVSKDYQGKRLGERALLHVFYNTAKAVQSLGMGTYGIIVDAHSQDSINFYKKYDFELLPGQTQYPKRMFIHIATVIDAI